MRAHLTMSRSSSDMPRVRPRQMPTPRRMRTITSTQLKLNVSTFITIRCPVSRQPCLDLSEPPVQRRLSEPCGGSSSQSCAGRQAPRCFWGRLGALTERWLTESGAGNRRPQPTRSRAKAGLRVGREPETNLGRVRVAGVDLQHALVMLASQLRLAELLRIKIRRREVCARVAGNRSEDLQQLI